MANLGNRPCTTASTGSALAVLGTVAERLPLLRAVNTVQSDALAFAVVQDGDDLVSEERFRTGHYLGSSTRQRN